MNNLYRRQPNKQTNLRLRQPVFVLTTTTRSILVGCACLLIFCCTYLLLTDKQTTKITKTTTTTPVVAEATPPVEAKKPTPVAQPTVAPAVPQTTSVAQTPVQPAVTVAIAEPITIVEETPPVAAPVAVNAPAGTPEVAPEPVVQPEAPPVQNYLDAQYPQISQEVKDLANRLTLTDDAKRILYRYDIQVFDSASSPGFTCGGTLESSNVVTYGCWRSGGTIQILRNHEPETTLAHEFLHAAYYDLSDDEVEQLDGSLSLMRQQHAAELSVFLRPYFRHADYRSATPRMKKWIEYNEIHSFAGTQFAQVPQALEDHYARYFQNRQTVVNFYLEAVRLRNQKRSEYEASEQRYYDQQQQQRDCWADFYRASDVDCSIYAADWNAYTTYRSCLFDTQQTWDYCQTLRPVFRTYQPANPPGSQNVEPTDSFYQQTRAHSPEVPLH